MPPLLRSLLPILSTISLLILLGATNPVPPYILPQGIGPYGTTLHTTELVDASRLDPFNSTHDRRLMISTFTPIPLLQCNHTIVPYFPPAVAVVQNQILGEYDYPPIFGDFGLDVCSSTPKDRNESRKFPLALLSPGLNTTRLFYSSLAQTLSSYGFLVVTLDHPYDVDVVQFPNGDIIYGGRVIKPADANGSTESVEHALEVRARDASFVLDVMGVRECGEALILGQSFGGAAAATAMLSDERFRAGVNLDGIMFGPVLNMSLGVHASPQAFLLWGSEGHNASVDSDGSWATFWDTLQGAEFVDYAKEMSIVNSAHGSYWDLNIMIDVAGIRDELSETATWLVGPILGERVWQILGRGLSSFFWHMLGKRDEDVMFQGPVEEFPEVRILHG
jgi:pimeloyl-ACP methyl ester carboxylesterase